jgi:hypothetical protein
MGLALMFVMVVATGYLLYLIYRDRKHREYMQAMRTTKWLLLLVAGYVVVLIIVSSISRGDVLGGGGEVRFCGLEIDCTRTASIIFVERRKTLSNPPHELIANGIYYLVTVKVTNNAPNPNLEPRNLSGVVVDAYGRKHQEFVPGERELFLTASNGGKDPYARIAGPTGGSYKKTLVFDLPYNIENPMLMLQDGSWTDRFLELFLIGDEDSMFHAGTRLQILIPRETL